MPMLFRWRRLNRRRWVHFKKNAAATWRQKLRQLWCIFVLRALFFLLLPEPQVCLLQIWISNAPPWQRRRLSLLPLKSVLFRVCVPIPQGLEQEDQGPKLDHVHSADAASGSNLGRWLFVCSIFKWASAALWYVYSLWHYDGLKHESSNYVLTLWSS